MIQVMAVGMDGDIRPVVDTWCALGMGTIIIPATTTSLITHIMTTPITQLHLMQTRTYLPQAVMVNLPLRTSLTLMMQVLVEEECMLQLLQGIIIVLSLNLLRLLSLLS